MKFKILLLYNVYKKELLELWKEIIYISYIIKQLYDRNYTVMKNMDFNLLQKLC